MRHRLASLLVALPLALAACATGTESDLQSPRGGGGSGSAGSGGTAGAGGSGGTGGSAGSGGSAGAAGNAGSGGGAGAGGSAGSAGDAAIDASDASDDADANDAADASDASASDASDASDAGTGDASAGDASDASAGDASDAGTGDAGAGDAGSGDAGTGDAGTGDAGAGDAGAGDAGAGDAGDAGAGDAGDAGAVADDSCPGGTLALAGSGASARTGSVSGTTVGHKDDGSGSCMFGSSGLDAVWSFTPDVDAYSAYQKGPFALDTTFTPYLPSEACPGDGASIVFAGSPLSATVSGDTSAMWQDETPTCLFGTSGKDAVYSFVAPQTGKLTVTMTPTGFDGAIYARSGSCTGSEISGACKDAAGSGGKETMSFTTTAGQTYWVFVDTYSSTQGGPFTLSLGY